MNQIFASSTLFWNASIIKMMHHVKQARLEGIELWAQQFTCRGYVEEDYVRLAEQYGLQTIVHSYSWDLNLSSLNAGIRQASVAEVVKSMQLAARIGAREVTVHPGHQTIANKLSRSNWVGGPYENFLYESLSKIAEEADKLGVSVSLEIMEKKKKEFVTSVEAMQVVTKDLFSAFSYTLDVAHCDSMFECLQMGNILSKDGLLSKIHISNRQGKTYHTPLGQGDYEFSDVWPQLLRYGVPLVMEGYDEGREFPFFYTNIDFLKAMDILTSMDI